MTKHIIKAESRKVTGRSVKKLRRTGLVPANLFGKEVPSTNIQVEEKELVKLIDEAGESSLVYLQVKGEKADRPAMISEIKRHPVSGQILHVALRQVNLKERTTASVSVNLVGEAPAEVGKLGILVQQLDAVEVEALPTDMPEELEIDISSLAAVDDAVYVKNIKTSDKYQVLNDLDEIVAKIEPLAAEEPKETPASTETEEAIEADNEEKTSPDQSEAMAEEKKAREE